MTETPEMSPVPETLGDEPCDVSELGKIAGLGHEMVRQMMEGVCLLLASESLEHVRDQHFGIIRFFGNIGNIVEQAVLYGGHGGDLGSDP